MHDTVERTRTARTMTTVSRAIQTVSFDDKIGYCGENVRNYWTAQAHSTTKTNTTATNKDAHIESTTTTPRVAHRFGECPGCDIGLDDRSDFVVFTSTGTDRSTIRCNSCYEVMRTINSSTRS
jgi:hypothetical protein